MTLRSEWIPLVVLAAALAAGCEDETETAAPADPEPEPGPVYVYMTGSWTVNYPAWADPSVPYYTTIVELTEHADHTLTGIETGPYATAFSGWRQGLQVELASATMDLGGGNLGRMDFSLNLLDDSATEAVGTAIVNIWGPAVDGIWTLSGPAHWQR